jgi:hypothetical protein
MGVGVVGWEKSCCGVDKTIDGKTPMFYGVHKRGE